METIQINIYSFNELSEQIKEKVINDNCEINVDYNWWQFVENDANQNGLKINSFDIDRGNYCDLEFMYSSYEALNLILKNCGKNTDIYRFANEFKNDFNKLVTKYSDGINIDIVKEGNEYDFDNNLIDLENEFINNLENEYLTILKKEYEYLTSDDAIKETIIINEYKFLENGKRYL